MRRVEAATRLEWRSRQQLCDDPEGGRRTCARADVDRVQADVGHEVGVSVETSQKKAETSVPGQRESTLFKVAF